MIKFKKKILGIESTAHTFSLSLIDEMGEEIWKEDHLYGKGSQEMIPSEMMQAHIHILPSLFKKGKIGELLRRGEISIVGYSMGPGIGPCLKVSTILTRYLFLKYSLEIYGVHHGLAHFEIVRRNLKGSNPLYVYLSGGHTTLLISRGGRLREVARTLDLSLGHLYDSLGKELGFGSLSGKELMDLAEEYKGEEEPLNFIVLRGGNFEFSGLYEFLTKSSFKKEKIAWILREVTQRALLRRIFELVEDWSCDSIIASGGVMNNDFLRTRISKECQDRKIEFPILDDITYYRDNGKMIALSAVSQKNKGVFPLSLDEISYDQRYSLEFASIREKFY